MGKLKVFYDYKSGRAIRLATLDDNIVWHLRTVELMRLLQRAFDYYQEKRIAEIGAEAFYREVFQLITKGVSEGRKKLIEEQFKQLGLLGTQEEQEVGLQQAEAGEEKEEDSASVPSDSQPHNPQPQPIEEHREPQPAEKQNQEKPEHKKREPDMMLPNDILRWALGEND